MPPCYHQDWMGRIGWYCVVKELGRGAMGVVYHAIHPHIGRPVPDQLLAKSPKTVSNDLVAITSHGSTSGYLLSEHG